MKSLDSWRHAVNADTWLAHRGRFLSASFLLERDGDQLIVKLSEGHLISVDIGPFVMPRVDFALRTSHEAWSKFCQSDPQPGFHDLMAMIRYKTLSLEGDPRLFMSNLLYFKDLFSRMRGEK